MTTQNNNVECKHEPAIVKDSKVGARMYCKNCGVEYNNNVEETRCKVCGNINTGERCCGTVPVESNNNVEGKCEHKWSAPVVAPYTYHNDNDPTLYTSYRIYISCEKCGEIKKYSK